ncbi:MAG TPA: PIG-L family deacetylase [Bryobacteraceae bacterium]|nr:PIG-L family deacetylase [Bryobacteraceae bacterium]
MIRTLLFFLTAAAVACAQDKQLHVIAFGAHPDDCDIRAGGTAAEFVARGAAVEFVSVTNGDAGHQNEGGGMLAKRRRAEAQESARRLGIKYVVLENHDGELLPTVDVRRQIIRLIREWHADIVLAPRPNDYHPDHRYTGVLVEDAAYMVVVPNVVSDTPPLRRNPAFFYYQDHFQKPSPFRPDVAIDIDDVFARKIDALDAQVSQFYEWLPWVDGKLADVPKDPVERKRWLANGPHGAPPTPEVRKALEKWYGPERAAKIKHAEAFELCEYGSQPNDQELRRLFPMLP